MEIRDEKCVALPQGNEKSAGWYSRHMVLAIVFVGRRLSPDIRGLMVSTTELNRSGPSSIPKRAEYAIASRIRYCEIFFEDLR